MKELKEIENELKELSKKHKPGKWVPESYIGAGNSDFVFMNLKVPYVRSAQKEGYSFSSKNINDQWKIWDYIWNNTKYFEVALSAAHFVTSRPIEEINFHRSMLLKWQKRVDNWALSDELSHFYSRLLEYDQKQMLSHFEKWNVSKNPWERRQSMVGLLFYSRFRTKTLTCSKILSFIKPHLNDSHYYVQKCVGWTLRECWNLYPDQTMLFLKKHAAIIPPAGWTAATEKLSVDEKKRLKIIRKNN